MRLLVYDRGEIEDCHRADLVLRNAEHALLSGHNDDPPLDVRLGRQVLTHARRHIEAYAVALFTSSR